MQQYSASGVMLTNRRCFLLLTRLGTSKCCPRFKVKANSDPTAQREKKVATAKQNFCEKKHLIIFIFVGLRHEELRKRIEIVAVWLHTMHTLLNNCKIVDI